MNGWMKDEWRKGWIDDGGMDEQMEDQMTAFLIPLI